MPFALMALFSLPYLWPIAGLYLSGSILSSLGMGLRMPQRPWVPFPAFCGPKPFVPGVEWYSLLVARCIIVWMSPLMLDLFHQFTPPPLSNIASSSACSNTGGNFPVFCSNIPHTLYLKVFLALWPCKICDKEDSTATLGNSPVLSVEELARQ